MNIYRQPGNSAKWLTAIVLLCCSACSNQIRVTEYPTNREAKLAGLTVYCWAEENLPKNALEKIEPTGSHHSAFDTLIRTMISSDLAKKGYQEARCADADFIIDYRVGMHEDVAAFDATFDDSPANRYGPRWRIGDDNSVNYEGLAKPDEEIITVRHGTIHVAAFSNTYKVLWHSAAEKTLSDHESDEDRKASMKSAVQKMMDGFPANSRQ